MQVLLSALLVCVPADARPRFERQRATTYVACTCTRRPRPPARPPRSALKALVLHSNALMQLPEGLTRLTGLRVLALSSNRLWQVKGAPGKRCLATPAAPAFFAVSGAGARERRTALPASTPGEPLAIAPALRVI